MVPSHVHGFRFLAEQDGLAGDLLSARHKISSMSHADRAVVGALRDTLSRRRTLCVPDPASEEHDNETAIQTVVKAAQGDSWAVARSELQAELIAVRQLGTETTVRDLVPVMDDLEHQLNLGQ